MTWVNLIDTVWGLIILYTIANLPFAVWLLRSFFQDMSPSFEESAMVDGCSRMEAFLRIVVPIALPGIIATSIFCLMSSWNEFLFALILTRVNAITIPVSLVRYVTSTAYLWGPISAAATVSVLPILVFALLIQKHLVRVMTLGVIKGE
jgi:multiple sugar transport system permease protein